MTLFLGNISALDCWRAARPRSMEIDDEVSRAFTGEYFGHTPIVSAQTYRELSEFGVRTLPVQLLVPHSSRRIRSTRAMSRVWSGPLPDGSFRRIKDGLFVCSPEFTFLQLANDFDLIESIKVGFELCGLYALRDDSEHGFVDRRIPLTTVRRLTAFVDAASGARGRRQAQRALRYVMERSRSPMETAEAMMLCLPPHLGGRGCPTPELNHRIPLKGLERKMARRSSVECDILWKDVDIGVEYDSDDFHSTPEQLTRDATKRTALGHVGLMVYTLTYDQVRDADRFDAFTRAIAGRARWRLPQPGPHFKEREEHLRSVVLPQVKPRW